MNLKLISFNHSRIKNLHFQSWSCKDNMRIKKSLHYWILFEPKQSTETSREKKAMPESEEYGNGQWRKRLGVEALLRMMSVPLLAKSESRKDEGMTKAEEEWRLIFNIYWQEKISNHFKTIGNYLMFQRDFLCYYFFDFFGSKVCLFNNSSIHGMYCSSCNAGPIERTSKAPAIPWQVKL